MLQRNTVNSKGLHLNHLNAPRIYYHSHKRPITICTTLLFAVLHCSLTFGHGGGLDGSGGHFNRKTGQYHCHRELCISQHEQVERATDEAEQTGASYSLLYNRDDWGGWIDADRDCQDTRAEILIRDSDQPVRFRAGRECSVSSGLWRLPYTGGTLTNARQLDIDHIIPLKWAHGHGGDRWPSDKKRQFANDPDNLLATSASANRSKAAKGPDQWMPLIDQCGYAKRWELLLAKYQLAVLPVETSALRQACHRAMNSY
jgi:hypothetical protein